MAGLLETKVGPKLRGPELVACRVHVYPVSLKKLATWLSVPVGHRLVQVDKHQPLVLFGCLSNHIVDRCRPGVGIGIAPISIEVWKTDVDNPDVSQDSVNRLDQLSVV